MDGEWEAYEFAKHYQDLGYFGHALEILLHNVLEDEAESGIGFEEGTIFAQTFTQRLHRSDDMPTDNLKFFIKALFSLGSSVFCSSSPNTWM